jgi:carbamate kinase
MVKVVRSATLVGMRALIALGGNALLRRGESADADAQQANVAAAAGALAGVASEHELVITHGNGPQVGLELALRNALPDRDLVAVPMGVVVDAGDSSLGQGSPPLAPQAVVELSSMRTLIDAGVLVICASGDGAPVMLDGDGTMVGVEAVIDKDLTASLLARRLDADILVMLTDVDAVRLDWGTEDERALGKVTPAELREYSFASGSMGPKVEAACRFVEATGRRAAIGELTKAVEIVRGASGTQISAPSA